MDQAFKRLATAYIDESPALSPSGATTLGDHRFDRQEAMHLMMHDTFQEEREAAGKWTRAQVTSTQLSTYFVGYQEHRDLRNAVKSAWGDTFSLKRYHDGTISFGSPPVRFVKALLLNQPIPQ